MGWLLGRDRDGGLCETVAVPAGNLHPLPDAVDTGLAPLIQVLATCVHGHELMPATPGDAVVIVGLGVTGLLHLQLAKLRGACPIVCVTQKRAASWRRRGRSARTSRFAATTPSPEPRCWRQPAVGPTW